MDRSNYKMVDDWQFASFFTIFVFSQYFSQKKKSLIYQKSTRKNFNQIFKKIK